MDEQKQSINKNKLSLNLDLRLICLLLLVVIGIMLAMWKPWQDSSTTKRKITVTGQSVVKAVPDEYQLSIPYYEKDTTAEVTVLNDQIIKKLKELGLSDSQIKNNLSRYDSPEIYSPTPVEGKEKATLNLSITTADKAQAQKVQDYLLTTNPKGSITPTPSFSIAKQKELTDKARSEAIADAKKSANKTATGLGSKIGSVLEVSDSQSDGLYPILKGVPESSISSDSNQTSLLNIQPGENEFTFKVQVIFELK